MQTLSFYRIIISIAIGCTDNKGSSPSTNLQPQQVIKQSIQAGKRGIGGCLGYARGVCGRLYAAWALMVKVSKPEGLDNKLC